MGPGLLRVQSALHLCAVRECVLLIVVLTELTMFKNPKFGFSH